MYVYHAYMYMYLGSFLFCQEQSARYWPEEKTTQFGDLFVETTSTKEHKTFTIREFMITHSKVHVHVLYHLPTHTSNTCNPMMKGNDIPDANAVHCILVISVKIVSRFWISLIYLQ